MQHVMELELRIHRDSSRWEMSRSTAPAWTPSVLWNNVGANTRVTVDGGAIRDTPALVDAINSLNTALTVNNVTLGMDPGEMMDNKQIRGDGIQILQTDAVNRSYVINGVNSMLTEDTVDILGRAIVLQTTAATTGTFDATVINNDLQSMDTTLLVRTGVNATADIVSLNVSGNTFETTGNIVPTNLAIDMLGNSLGGDAHSLRIDGFSGNTVTGNAVGGGARIESATIFAFGGTTNIGSAGERVSGDGLALIDVSGFLSFNTLNIGNEDGVGLLVDTKTGPTNFTLETGNGMPTGSGTIDTVGGPAMFLDPLTVNMTLDSVVSAGSVIGPGISNGDGVTLQDVVGNLNIADFQVSNAAMEGLHISQGAGIGTLNVTLDTIMINGTGSHGVLVADTMGSNNTSIMIGSVDMDGMVVGGTITNTGGDGININNVDSLGSLFTIQGTTFTGIGGFTGNITDSRISGDQNVDTAFTKNTAGTIFGTILFNDGVDQIP